MELVKKTTNTITQKILDTLIDHSVDIKKYNQAIEDYNDLGGIDSIAVSMGWDDDQKQNWKNKILNVYSFKT
jgi:hypothetical protein